MIKLLNLFICQHLETVRKADKRSGRLYLACTACPWESPGILTGPAHAAFVEPDYVFIEDLL